MDSNAAPLQAKLEEARRRLRSMRVASGGAYAVAVVLVLALFCYRADRAAPLTAAAREVWDAVILLSGLLTGAGAALTALLLRIPDAMLAERIERRYPELRERLASTVNLVPLLAATGESDSSGFSMAMISSLAGETERAAAGMDFRSAIDARPMRRAALAAALATVLVLLEALAAPAAFGVWMERMAHPGAGVAPYASTRVWLTTGKELLRRGGALDVAVTTRGRQATGCVVHYREEGAGAWKIAAMRRTTAGAGEEQFGLRLGCVTRSLSLYATANDGRSDEHRVSVEDPPTLLGIELTVHFPAYMHRAAQALSESTGNVVAPFGSVVGVRASANKPLRAAQFRLGAAPPTAWEVSDQAVQGRLDIRSNGSYAIMLTDRNGFTNPTPLRYEIRAIPDQPPTVQIDHPAADIDLAPGGSTPLIARATDDYGVESMRLSYTGQRVRSIQGRAAEADAYHGGLPLPGPTGAPQADARIRWSIASLHSLPGDTIRYEVDARDNDTLSGPHTGRSAVYRIHVVSVAEMQRRLKDQLDEEARALEQIHERQREAQRQARIARKTGDTKALGRAVEAQNAAAQETLTLAERSSRLTDELENNNLATQSELKTRDEAVREMQELGRQKMPHASQSLQSAQEEAAGRQQALVDAERAQSEAERDIERVQSLLARQAGADRLADLATQLALRQKELADSAQNLSENARALRQTSTKASADDIRSQREGMEMERQRQADTTDSTNRLLSQLERAAETSRERGQREVAAAMRRAADALRRGAVQQHQGRAQSALDRNDPGNAARSQALAAQAMQRAAEAARDAAAKTEQETPEAAARRLEEAAQRLERMASRQQQIADSAQKTPDASQTARLAGAQRDLERQARRVESSLGSAPAGQESLKSAKGSMSRSAASLGKNDAGSASSPARDAAKSLRQAAEQASEASAQIRQQQAANEMQDRVEYLAQVENGLYGATRRLDGRQTRDPLTQKEIQELSQVAARQRQVEAETREIAQKMPSQSFKETLRIAASDMAEASAALNQQPAETGGETQDAQQRAARMLEAVATALKEQANSGRQAGDSQDQGQSPSSPQQAQQGATIGDLSLAHALEQEIRENTGSLDQQRARREGKALTEQQQREARRIASLQHATRDITSRAARHLATEPSIQQEAEMAQGEMEQAEQRLGRYQTGRPPQSAEEAALSHLDQAIKQAQDSSQQQQQQEQQQAAQQGMPQPAMSSQGGQSPVMRLQSSPRSMSTPDLRAGRIGPLPPRTQQTLREGQQERVPAEYQEVVSRYFRSLATRKP